MPTVWGKGQLQVRAAVNQMRLHLPFNLLGIDSDNGSEFINQYFYNYCRQQNITLPVPAPTRRMTAAMWNRRMGM